MQKPLLIPFVILLSLFIIHCGGRGTGDWEEDIVYFILIDRFHDGDPSNNDGGVPESHWMWDGVNPEALKTYQGGDLVGIIKRLDYLRSMGVTTLWISPFLDNSNTDYVGWWPYHGYHPIDFKAVDEHFGTLEDLKLLVNEVHARQMKIIFDMPFNQVAADHPWLDDPEKQDWFHWGPDGNPVDITDWFDQDQIERGELHGLPDLAQENDEVYDYLLEVSRYWFEETGCDGFRLDAVKHIPVDFWRKYNRDIRELAGEDFLLLGEVFWGEVERLEPYIGLGFNALFDIPGYYAIRNAFAQNASMAQLSDFLRASTETIHPEIRATLLDNHDVPRFNTRLGESGWDRTRVALTWLLTTPGMPVLYYGTELGEEGAPLINPFDQEPQDYLNRLPYPENTTIRQTARLTHTIGLIQMRRNKDALRRGDFHELYKDWSIYAYLRSDERSAFLVVLSTSSVQEYLNIPLPKGYALSEDPLKMMGNGSARLEEEGLFLRLPPFAAGIWQLDQTPPDDLAHWVPFTDRLSGDFVKQPFFYFDERRQVRSLQIAGDFTNWQPRDVDTRRSGDTLHFQIPLKPGRYQYKLVLNGQDWIADPEADGFVMDPYGGRNSQIYVRPN